MKQDSPTVGSNSRLRRDALVYASLFIAYLTIDSVHDGKKCVLVVSSLLNVTEVVFRSRSLTGISPRLPDSACRV